MPFKKELVEAKVKQELFELVWGPYWSAHFLVPKKDGRWHFIISALSANKHTLEDAGVLPNVEEFSEALPGLPIFSLIDFHSGYDQKVLNKESRDYMAFQTTQGMYRPTRLVQGATNSVSAFVRLTRKILSPNLGGIAEVFINDIGVKGPRFTYNDEEVELPAGLPGVRRIILEHLQNLDTVLTDVERAGGTIL